MQNKRFLVSLSLLLLAGCQSPPWTLKVTEEVLPTELSELAPPQTQGSSLDKVTVTHLILQGDVEGVSLNHNYKRVPIGERTLAEATDYYQKQPGVDAVYPDLPAEALGIPNDPKYGDQWALFTMQAFPVYDRLDAQDTSKINCANVIVGVVDTGVDVYHEDLQTALMKDIGGQVLGKNFVTAEGGERAIQDLNRHGTHVAGIIAATRNNGKGIAGITNCKILPVKVLGENATGSAFDIIDGIKYAVDNGARVINLSIALGVTYIYPPMQDALNYASNKSFSLPGGGTATGSVVIAAAGNNGSAVVCPATDPTTIAVSSISQFAGPSREKYWEFLSSFSSRGDRIDVCAPGGRILSTIHSLTPPSNRYEFLSGTSMAAPQVTAMAALILAQHPTWSATQVKAKIRSSVDDLGAPGWDPMYGCGRINLLKAME